MEGNPIINNIYRPFFSQIKFPFSRGQWHKQDHRVLYGEIFKKRRKIYSVTVKFREKFSVYLSHCLVKIKKKKNSRRRDRLFFGEREKSGRNGDREGFHLRCFMLTDGNGCERNSWGTRVVYDGRKKNRFTCAANYSRVERTLCVHWKQWSMRIISEIMFSKGRGAVRRQFQSGARASVDVDVGFGIGIDSSAFELHLSNITLSSDRRRLGKT